MMRIAVVAGLVAGATFASAQISPAGGAFLFRAKFASGSRVLYTVTASGGPKDMVVGVSLPITEKVVRVTNGLATLQVVVGKSKITRNGHPVSMGSGTADQPETVKLDSRNESPGKDTLSRQTHISFPLQPVKIGASWTTVAYVPFGQGVQKVNATYTLSKFENIKGQRSARLATFYRGNGGATITGSGTMWVSARDGSLVKGNMSLTIKAGANEIPVTVHIDRS